jgi:transglutaminase-like putative cysteine protease
MPEFKIQHLTKYTYPAPVRDSANQVILYPIQDEWQEVIKQDIHVSGDPVIDTFIDYYGNKVGSFTYSEPHSTLLINSRILVQTKHKPFPGNDIFPAQQWEDLKQLRYMVPYIDFLKLEYFDGFDDLKALVEAEKSKDDTPYQAVLRFSRHVYENFQYIKGVTSVETTMDEIWKLKAGVCQDFAHILTLMLRLVGIPARYVSGYICTHHSANMRGEGATHAWAEAYIPDYGWLGIDPTNNCIANEAHIRLAVGRNFSDCSPVKGVYKGASDHRLDVSVAVGYEDDAPYMHQPGEFIEVPEHKPVSTFPKNSYQRYMEMLQQQQQQQQ